MTRTRNLAPPEEHVPLTWLAYLILLALGDRPLHGYGIIKEVENRTDGATRIEAGTLYAAIKRLRDRGLLRPAAANGSPAGASTPEGADGADIEPAAGRSRRRDYELTGLGRDVLALESERLAGLVEVAREKRILPADTR